MKKSQSELAEERMRLALKAAAIADEKLGQNMPTEPASSEPGNPSLAVLDHSNFASSVAAIEKDSFVSAAFSSSARLNNSKQIKEEAPPTHSSHDEAIFGSLSVSGFTLKPETDMKPISTDPDDIIHPSLYCDPEEKMERWIQRLSMLRRKKLEGDAM